MATFADDQIISTAGGDANGDFTFPLTGQTLPTGTYVLMLAGTWGSRTLNVQAEDRSGNKLTLEDEDGVAMSAVGADKIVVVTIAKSLTLTMAGTGTALITVTLAKAN